MAASNFVRCLANTQRWEGGYVNHPRDPGGATNFGVIQRVYDRFRTARGLPRRAVRHIAKSEVQAIYTDMFWNKISGDAWPKGQDQIVFDAAVNSGPARGPKWSQRALGVKADGKVGPQTLAAARAAQFDPNVIKRACAYRLGFMKSLRIWGTFGKGWARRVANMEAIGVKMVRELKQAARSPSEATDARRKHVQDELAGDAQAANRDAAKAGQVSKTSGAGGAASGGGAGLAVDPSVEPLIFMGLAGFAVLALVVAFVFWNRQRNHQIRADEYNRVARGAEIGALR